MNRSLMAGLVAGALALAACGDDDTALTTSPRDDTTVPPAGDGAIVAELQILGFFPVGPPYLPPPPAVTVYADGRVIVPGVQTLQYPGPMVGPLVERRIDAADVQALLDQAEEAGLLADPPNYDEPVPPTADAPITSLTLTTAEGSWTHDAPALSDSDTGARGALYDFTTELQGLADPNGELYTPDRLAIQAIPADEAADVEGELQPSPVDWPDSGPDLADATVRDCVVVDDPATIAVLRDATAITRFRQGDEFYAVAAVPVLPGTPGC